MTIAGVVAIKILDKRIRDVVNKIGIVQDLFPEEKSPNNVS
jgi:hypothetical protein